MPLLLFVRLHKGYFSFCEHINWFSVFILTLDFPATPVMPWSFQFWKHCDDSSWLSTRSTWEEGTSTEELPQPDWPVGMSVEHLFNGDWCGRAEGGSILRQVCLGYKSRLDEGRPGSGLLWGSLLHFLPAGSCLGVLPEGEVWSIWGKKPLAPHIAFGHCSITAAESELGLIHYQFLSDINAYGFSLISWK